MSIDRIIDGISAELDLWWRGDLGIRFELPEPSAKSYWAKGEIRNAVKSAYFGEREHQLATWHTEETQEYSDYVHAKAVRKGALCIREDCSVCGPVQTWSNMSWEVPSATDIVADLQKVVDEIERDYKTTVIHTTSDHHNKEFPGDVIVNADGVRFDQCTIRGKLIINGTKSDVRYCRIEGGVQYAETPDRLPNNCVMGPPARPVHFEPLQEPCQCGNSARRPGTWDEAAFEIRDIVGNHWRHHPSGCTHTKTPICPIERSLQPEPIGARFEETCCGGVAMRATCPYHGPGAR